MDRTITKNNTPATKTKKKANHKATTKKKKIKNYPQKTTQTP
jgi:hypothetical protein